MEKAWMLDLSKVEEGYLYSDFIVYAENRNQAKKKMLGEIKYEGMCLPGEAEELVYLTIPVIRSKEQDKKLYQGEFRTTAEIERLEKEEVRKKELQDVLDNVETQYCYVKKYGNYYRPDSCGYTEYQIYAGVYSKEDAVRKAMSCQELRVVPIDVEEHNELLIKTIEKLKTRII